jgi:hypothetical protein
VRARPPPLAESSIVKLLEARRNRVRRTPDAARPTLKGLRRTSGQARRTSPGVRRTSRDARQASGQARHTPKDMRRSWEEARPMPDDLRRGPGGAGHALRAVRLTPDDLPRTPQDERDMRQREMRNQGSARAWRALFAAPPNSSLACDHRSPTPSGFSARTHGRGIFTAYCSGSTNPFTETTDTERLDSGNVRDFAELGGCRVFG